MCGLTECPYEEGDNMQCAWCVHNDDWTDSYFDDFEDFDD